MKPSTAEKINRILFAAAKGKPEVLADVVLDVLEEQDKDTRHDCIQAIEAFNAHSVMVKCAQAACRNGCSV